MTSNAALERQTPNQSSTGGGTRPLPAAIQLSAPSIYNARAERAAERDRDRDERTPLSPTRRGNGGVAASPPSGSHHRGKHWWLDYVPLPYALVAPKLLIEKVAEDEQEARKRKQQQQPLPQPQPMQLQDGESKDADNISRRTRSGGNGANLTRRHSPTLSPSPAARVARITGSSQTAARASSDPTHPLALREAKLNFLRHLFAELLGTCILAWTHGMLRVKDQLKEISAGDDALFAGATLVLLIYSLGEVSGAHFNPVVTLSFGLRQMFPWEWIVPYWCMQLGGALCAGALLRGFYGEENAWRATNFVAPLSRLSELAGMTFEICITFMLVFVILSVSQRGKVIGVHAALAVGATIGLAVALGANITGGSMNPFRSLGPAIVNGPLYTVWPCVVGPIIGGLIACTVSWMLASENASPGWAAAMGKGKEEPDDADT